MFLLIIWPNSFRKSRIRLFYEAVSHLNLHLVGYQLEDVVHYQATEHIIFVRAGHRGQSYWFIDTVGLTAHTELDLRLELRLDLRLDLDLAGVGRRCQLISQVE